MTGGWRWRSEQERTLGEQADRPQNSFVSFVLKVACAMTTAPAERTVLPGGPTSRMAELLTVLEASRRPALVSPDGVNIELPDELYEVLRDVTAALSQGVRSPWLPSTPC